jgi:hypothetical protein
MQLTYQGGETQLQVYVWVHETFEEEGPDL